MRKLLISAALAAVTMPLCMAAPASADVSASACQRNDVTSGYRGPGTVVNKASSTCNDLNVTYVVNTTPPLYDDYAGFYRTSNGVWHIGTRGYIRLYDGSVNWVVLLSDVNTGTPMSVGSYFDGGDYVEIAH